MKPKIKTALTTKTNHYRRNYSLHL